MTRQGIDSPSHPHGHTLDGQLHVDTQGPTTIPALNTTAFTTLESQELNETTTAALNELVCKTGHNRHASLFCFHTWFFLSFSLFRGALSFFCCMLQSFMLSNITYGHCF